MRDRPGLRALLRPANTARLAVALLLAAPAPALAEKPNNRTLDPQPIEIEALAFDLDAGRPDRKTFGKLRWLGGIELSSRSDHFAAGRFGHRAERQWLAAPLAQGKDRMLWLEPTSGA